MKLQNIAEAKTVGAPGKLSVLERVFAIGKKIKPDLTLNDLAWCVSMDDMEYASESDLSTLAHYRYDPSPGFKDNPAAIDDYLEIIDDDTDEELKARLSQWFEDYT